MTLGTPLQFLLKNTWWASGGLVPALPVYMFSLSSIMTVLNCINYRSIINVHFFPRCAFDWRVPVRSQLYIVPVLCRTCLKIRESQPDHVGHCCSKQKSSICPHQILQLSGPFPRLILNSVLWWAPLCSTPRALTFHKSGQSFALKKWRWH